MFLFKHEMDFKGAENKQKKELMEHARSIDVHFALNQISACRVTYPDDMDALALEGASEKSTYPFAMRLTADLGDDAKNTTKKVYFTGYLDKISIVSRRGEALVLDYSDPLLTLREKDDPRIWQSRSQHTLQTIIDDLMGPSFDRSGGRDRRALKTNFLSKAPEIIMGANNMGHMDLDFVQDLCQRYGFHFFFQHDHEPLPEFLVTFDKTDFGKEAKSINQSIFADGYVFTGGVSGFLDTVKIEHSAGQANVTALIKNLTRNLPSFAPKLKARQDAGYELIYNDQQPSMAAAEAQIIADAILLQSALQSGDTLEFASSTVLKVGDYVEVRKNEKAKLHLPSRVLGKYLINDVVSTFRGQYWMHNYKLVRP